VHVSVLDTAMKFFEDDGICAQYMSDRENRNKIYSYFANEHNAGTFLRVSDRYKNDYVLDFILRD
jgi:hypothetical protein